jgi:quercetin dioxygenase-like cupin family protein
MKPFSNLVLMAASALIASAALADVPGEPALAHAAGDSQLQWGPCPPFLPQGCGIAALHGDPAKPNLDVYFRVPGHSQIAAHWHTSAERMVLVSGEMTVTYAGQKTTTLKPGMYAYGPARVHHSGECVSAEPCVLFIAFEAPLDAMPVEKSQ